MRLALIPLNPTVGDVAGNAAAIARRLGELRGQGVDLAVFPELSICGYPPKDLLLHSSFLSACRAAVEDLGRSQTEGLAAVFGLPRRLEGSPGGSRVANSLAVYADGAPVAEYDKRLLPTYDVFDEDRYFEPGDRAVAFDVAGVRVGLAVCEDLWKGIDAGFGGRYLDANDPIAALGELGVDLIVAPSASPFVLGKSAVHREILAQHARLQGVSLASVNQLGGNDDLVFDGQATLVNRDGELVSGTQPFSGNDLIVDLPEALDASPLDVAADDDRLLFDALVIGVRDYLAKTGFRRALLGVSGGIDSAVTAAIACAALGSENVLGVSMPGRYSSEHSRTDAEELARRLGMRLETVPIVEPVQAFRGQLDPAMTRLGFPRLGEILPDLSEENLQARVRGTILMTLSNRSGALLLTTGNKSELAVGYCTLYGDMNGGLAVLSDVAKMLIYRLSRYMNEHHAACGFEIPPIPENTISKPPSAELAPGQVDSDSLPDYEILDEIVERLIEQRQAIEDVAEHGELEEPVVRRVARLIDLNEYKRKQAAIGIKVTSVAFGQGRRMPIAQRWQG